MTFGIGMANKQLQYIYYYMSITTDTLIIIYFKVMCTYNDVFHRYHVTDFVFIIVIHWLVGVGQFRLTTNAIYSYVIARRRIIMSTIGIKTK